MTLPVGGISAVLELVGVSQFQAGITGAQRSLDLAGTSATRAAAGIDKANTALTANATASTRAASAMAKNRAAMLQAVAATERYEAAAASGTASTAKLASAEASMIRANERVAATAQQAALVMRSQASESVTATAATERFASGIGATISTLGKLGVAVGAFELAKQAIDIGKEAANYQRQMTLIQTLTGQSAAEVSTMSKAILGLAGSVGSAPDDLATSLYHVEQNGIHGAQALQVTATAAKAAKIGMADVEATTNSMTSAVASGIKGVQNMDQAAGALLATVGTGDMKMSDLNDALSNGILSVAKTYGLSLHDVGAALATFGDLNIRGADAASDLRQAIMAFAKPTEGPAAKKMLDELGMSTATLAEDMQNGGLNEAVTDLRNRLAAAGVTGDKVGQALLDMFGKKAGVGVSVLIDQYDRLQTKYAELDKGSQSFAEKWAETQKTAGFQLERLGAEAKATGIELEQRLLPVGTKVTSLIATGIPAAISIAAGALHPFTATWHALSVVIEPVASAIIDVVHTLGPAAPALKGVAGAALAMWVAFKGYTIAREAVYGVMTAVSQMSANVVTGTQRMKAEFGATGAQLGTQSAIMQAEFAKVAASAQASAADQAEAQAMVARAFQTTSEEQIVAMESAATAARAEATEMAAAAETAAAGVETAGAAARVGLASLAGPLGIAAVGLTALIPLLRGSGSSAQASAAQVDTYTQAIKADSDAIGENTRQAAVNALSKAGALEAARQLGLNLSTVTDAALGNAAATSKITDALAQYNDKAADARAHGIAVAHANDSASDAFKRNRAAAQTVTEAIGAQSGAVGKAVQTARDQAAAEKTSTDASTAHTSALTQQKAAQAAATATAAAFYGLTGKDGVTAYEAAVKAAQASTAQTQAQTLAFEMENNAAGLVNQALATMAGQNLSNAQAQTSMEQAVLTATTALKKNSGSLSQHTTAGLADRQAIEGAVSAIQAKMTAEAQASGSTVKATAQYKANSKALLDQIGKLDGTKSAAYKYAQQLLKIPPVAKTKIDLENAAALKALREVKASVAGLAAAISALPPVDINKVGQRSTIQGHASGAIITAGTTPTADDVLVRVSKGEAIIPAGQVSKNRGLVGALINGTDGFASGGVIAGVTLPKGMDKTERGIVSAVLAALKAAPAALVTGALSAVQTIRAAIGSAVAVAPSTPSGAAAAMGVSDPAAIAAVKAAQQAKTVLDQLNKESATAAAHATALATAETNLRNARSADEAQLQKSIDSLKKQALAVNTSTKAGKDEKAAIEAKIKSEQLELTTAKHTTSGEVLLATQRAAAAKTVAKAASDAASTQSKAYDALKSAADAATQAVTADAQAVVSTLQSQEQDVAQSVSSLQSSISGDLTNGTSLSSLWQQLSGTDANGNPITPDLAAMRTGLDQVLATTQSFADDLTQVAGEGGSQTLVQQIADMGTQAGDGFASQLLAAGPGAVAAMSSTLAAIQSIADDEGTQLAQGFYGAGVKSMQNLIAAIEKAFPSVRKALAPIAAQLAGMFTLTATATPTAVPGFASGVTNFSGGWAMVGEAGPELLNLPRGSSVVPTNRVKDAGFGSDPALVAEVRALRAEVRAASQANTEVTLSGAERTVTGMHSAARTQAQTVVTMVRSQLGSPGLPS